MAGSALREARRSILRAYVRTSELAGITRRDRSRARLDGSATIIVRPGRPLAPAAPRPRQGWRLFCPASRTISRIAPLRRRTDARGDHKVKAHLRELLSSGNRIEETRACWS
jgi:hypothetical protein